MAISRDIWKACWEFIRIKTTVFHEMRDNDINFLGVRRKIEESREKDEQDEWRTKGRPNGWRNFAESSKSGEQEWSFAMTEAWFGTMTASSYKTQ